MGLTNEKPAAVSALAARVPGNGRSIGLVLLRQALPIPVVIVCLLLLREEIVAIDVPEVLATVERISATQWLVALLATAVSFRALGDYDAVIQRYLGLETFVPQARQAGMTAIAVSQTLGFGVITGALVRWRMLPGMSLWQASRVTIVVSGFFLLGAAILAALAMSVFPPDAGPLAGTVPRMFAMVFSVTAGLALMLAGLFPKVAIGQRRISMPPLAVLIRLLGLTAVDTLAATLALWVLMPAEIFLGFTTIFPVYLLALGAGMFLATPGGVGPFEFALIGLMPQVPAETWIATVLAYRLVYFALPAVFAAVVLVRGPKNPAVDAAAAWTLVEAGEVSGSWPDARRAETGLIAQRMHGALFPEDHRNGWLTGRTGQALVGLFDPFTDREPDRMIAFLRHAASRERRVPLIYKCTARTAVLARRAGMVVCPIGQELWVAPDQTRHLAGPEHAGLRRKLRKAEKAGVRVPPDAATLLPLFDMAEIAGDWAARRRGERGFSMGRFAPEYVARQKVFLAYRKDRLVGFATFHRGHDEWVLDLMRTRADAPDGTMHLLVFQAINEAAFDGARRLSLAALPMPGKRLAGLSGWVSRRIERLMKAHGLRQFKSSFAPRYQTLYAAGPGRFALAMALADTAREIRWPEPLPSFAEPDGAVRSRRHLQYPASDWGSGQYYAD